VGVGWEAVLGSDSVFVEDAEAVAEFFEGWVVVVCEGKCMIGIKPAMVGMSARSRATRSDFGVCECFRHYGCFDAHGLFGAFEGVLLVYQVLKFLESGLRSIEKGCD